MLQKGERPSEYAKEFIDPEKGVESVDDALAGAQDIIAEKLTEIPGTRESMRRYYWGKGIFRSRVRSGQEEEVSKFRDYFEWDEPVGKCPSHRVLAMLRGEKQNVLSLKITVPEEKAVEIVASNWIKNPESEEGLLIQEAVRDGYRRLLAPAMETETRLRSKEFADEEAIAVFSENLRKLLLAAPLGSEAVMAIDPGFRTGCKVVCLDKQGVLLCDNVIFPFMSEEKKQQAGSTVLQLLKQYEILFIAVGNGTAGRETEAFLAELEFPGGVSVGEVAYQQSAGFLRIRGRKNPLDASAVHPESYSIVLKMAASLAAEVRELIESEELRHSIRLEDFITDNAGLPTLRDIMKELEKPGRNRFGWGQNYS